MTPNENQQISNYFYLLPITTRWIDNDMFGHVNNVNYYAYFDSVINQFLIEKAGFNPQKSPQVGFVVESNCQYFSPISYPDKLIGALRINRLGKSSVEYGVAIFKDGEEKAAAAGKMTHVFVDRISQKPAAINSVMRLALDNNRVISNSDDQKIVGQHD